jgi:hypothetical protein
MNPRARERRHSRREPASHLQCAPRTPLPSKIFAATLLGNNDSNLLFAAKQL